MPSKKKKYNARFPAGRIKKIMQTDEEVGKVAQAVPVIISRTLELFVESLLTKSMQITLSRNAKTLTPSHMKQCILSESRFDFLKDLVKDIPDASLQEDNENNVESLSIVMEEPTDGSGGSSLQTEQSTSTGRAPVIQYGPTIINQESPQSSVTPTPAKPLEPKFNFSIENLSKSDPRLQIDLSNVTEPDVTPKITLSPTRSISTATVSVTPASAPVTPDSNIGQNTSDNLYIDEDYDN